MASISRFTTLAREILEHATVIEDYCQKNNVAPPSFEVNGPPHFQIPPSHPEAATAHAALLHKTLELNQLALGPTSLLMTTDTEDTVSLQAIYRFKVAQAVPLDQEVSFEELSTKCDLNVIDLRRLVRLAMTRHIFVEKRPGFVSHTSASKVLAQSQLLQDFVGISTEEKFKASAFTVDALSKWNGAETPNQSGYSLGHNTDKGLYEFFQANPARGRRWANAMSQFASRIPLDSLYKGFDWASLGASTVVDVGGGHGPVSVGLATHFPALRFIVQDFPDVIGSHPPLDPSIADRIEYTAHDLLKDQPIKGAAVYFFRAVFHNLPDAQCVQVLAQHARVMDAKSRMVLNEPSLHEPGTVPAWQDRMKRDMDMKMMVYFRSRERGEDDWRELLALADPRLELRKESQITPGDRNILVIGLKAE